jgi:hypothetical protein
MLVQPVTVIIIFIYYFFTDPLKIMLSVYNSDVKITSNDFNNNLVDQFYEYFNIDPQFYWYLRNCLILICLGTLHIPYHTTDALSRQDT